MPITGTETTLTQLLVKQIKLSLNKRGNSQIDEKSIEGIAEGIANAIIPHLTANVTVNPGIAVVGSLGPGSTTTPGQIS